MAIGASDFGADVRADAGLFRGHVEAGGAGDVVVIENSQGREVECGGAGHQLFRNRRPFQEAECAAAMELNVRGLGVGIGELALWLVIGAFYKPMGIAVNAVQGAVGERDVPFVAIPDGSGPPIARGAPRPGGVEHLSVNAGSGETAGAVAVEF